MNLHGPQSDRDQMWGKGPIKREDKKNDQVYESEVMRLKSENKSLKDQLQRSMKELKSYQVRYPSPYSSATSAESKHNGDENFPSWSASPEIMTALFEAYDTRILELEDNIKQMTAKMEGFKGNMDVLIRENEELRAAQLERVKGNAAAGGVSSSTGLDPNAPLNAEVIAALQEEVGVLRGENNLLMEQRARLMGELEGHQAELEKKTLECAQNSQHLAEAAQELQTFNDHIVNTEQERDAAAAQALKYSDLLGKVEIEKEELQEQLARYKQKCTASDALVAEFQKQLRSSSAKSEDDSVSAYKRVHDAEARVRELHSLLLAKEQELDAARAYSQKLSAEYQTTRQDAEGMLQVMGGLERQLNEYMEREAQTKKQAQDSREKVEETLTLREQFNAREEQNKQEIDRLLKERKSVSLKRKDEIERAIDQSRKVMSEQIGRLEKDMEDMAEKNAKLIFEAEKATRDGRSARELYERVQRLHEEEHKGVSHSLRELSEQLESVTKQKEQETAKRADALEQLKELRAASERQRIQLEDLRAQLSQAERAHETAVAGLKATIRELQRDNAELGRSAARKGKDFEDAKAALTAQIAALERKHQDESALYQSRAAEAERVAQDLEASGFAGDLRTQTTIDQLKEKYVATVAQLETKLKNEMDAVKQLGGKLKNSESVIGDLLHEKSNIARLVEVTQNELKQQEDELQSCRATISDLTSQLTSSHQAREEGALRAARTIEELQSSGGEIPAVAHTSSSPHHSPNSRYLGYGATAVAANRTAGAGRDVRYSVDSLTST